MKVTVKPFTPEESEYYNDYTGEKFEKYFGPQVKLKLSFGNGSRYDGAHLAFDLNDEDIQDIMSILKEKLCSQTKERFKKYLNEIEEEYEDSMDSRNWDSCEVLGSSMLLYRYFLNIPGFEDFVPQDESEESSDI